ncbi:MAG: 16S rRNA (cytosine(1402)-N(4))-methyltransferase RsmH [Syntrophomonas sp.]|uniref:16S rRNA (cytosine(1402)-N(4))-methyltransferase RsmH n=1 Tax=Syntrophomonas sp. TaxID=2053627 RepID=UPI00262E49D9|nr:16S rRNA (cytosine(1402)-N(4))-methyltransferase RsmH [Syntrophomonas sp.]MDD2509641.1 16S rRNA (cytosine(1402)-N(4))-methyltransferase RsmH [Syntrophomonas sp.]MDD3878956.1 16S rRNA (cytosine(1402)-N(4))-methyltransferase RsmH [Syntrophomonas sp.]MDD4625697.1 16S rRNA (cytosine(1402)-N(4))-methyltransferase RsmH [Syntrophomonas sp.]
MHIPVLLDEVIASLLIDQQGSYVDCTLGGGGHLERLLEHLKAGARVLAIDKDVAILEQSRQRLQSPNITFVHGDFRDLKEILKQEGILEVDGILLDLGVSSFQLDMPERGFSFHEDADLDMRMNQEQDLKAWEIINRYPEKEIAQILFDFGEERYSRRIAVAITKYRKTESIDSTLQLVEIIKAAVPAAYRREKHPARKSFQALRIAVNSELEALREVLPQALEALNVGGRLCVITFHSLEDRLVKEFMKNRAKDCICPSQSPICTCGHQAELKIISRKPIVASKEECEANPRARSAKLRVAEKLSGGTTIGKEELWGT